MLFHMCRCGAMIPQNTAVCTACAAGQNSQMSRHMEYNRFRRNKKAAAFYTSDIWRTTRARAIALYDGVDIYAYYTQHKIMTADMVHHIEPLEDNWNRRLDLTNLLPLSNQNHGIIEALYSKDEETKRRTQQQLIDLIATHWEGQGGVEKVLYGI